MCMLYAVVDDVVSTVYIESGGRSSTCVSCKFGTLIFLYSEASPIICSLTQVYLLPLVRIIIVSFHIFLPFLPSDIKSERDRDR